MKTKLLASTLTLGLASSTLAFGLSATPAQASITMWNAENKLGFCSWAPPQVDPSTWGNTGGVNLTGNMPISTATPPPPGFGPFGGCGQGTAFGANLPDTLSWGTEGVPGLGRSQLVLNNSNGVDVNPFSPTGTLLQNPVKLTAGAGFADPYFSIIHRNFPISSENNEPFLTNFRLLNDLVLTPIDPPPGKDSSPIDLGLLNFDGIFNETPNIGSCITGGTAVGGDPSLPGFGCPDVFVLNQIGVGPGAVTVDSVAQLNSLPARSFMRDGFQYDIFFQASGFMDLPASVCNTIAGRSTCVGFITTENLNNFSAIQLRLEKTAKIQVPEPSSLAGILAVGMVGLGLLGKRKKAE